MVELTDFEKQRQLNISRNKELFKKLNLDTASRDFHNDAPLSSDANNRRKKANAPSRGVAKKAKVNKEPVLPTRRSSRLAGVTLDSNEERQLNTKMEDERKKREDEERLKRIRLTGDIKLTDVITDESAIAKFASGKGFSFGDFFETIKNSKGNGGEIKVKNEDDKDVDKLRSELDQLELYPHFHPNDVKLTSQRMTAITFHPNANKKLIIGGDTNGEMGIWSVEPEKDSDENESSEPNIMHFRVHGKNIPRFEFAKDSSHEILSCSYDGSIRSMDLTKFVSKSVLEFDDAYGNASGISDIRAIDGNVIYFTTLQGEFGKLDQRLKNNNQRDQLGVLRLHEKKIGSFAVNPSFEHQIVTASLDRSMRVWDLRMINKSNSWTDSFADEDTPHCIGMYSSRLSVSTADWNNSGDIVCNGYDDTINIFNLGDTSKKSKTFQYPIIKEEVADVEDDEFNKTIPNNLRPDHTIKHNCQTGRWVSILKAKWQVNPSDGVEKFVIGNMNRYFDVYNKDGVQLAHLGSSFMTSVPAVSAFHPTENWLIGGNASGKAFLFSQ